MRRLRDCGLTLVLTALFLVALAATGISGWLAENARLLEHGQPPLGLSAYLLTGGFASAVMENWESEFLQMGVYVVLTAFLFQRGSAESKDPDAPPLPPLPPVRDPVARLGRFLKCYSLGIVLFGLFLATFAGHLAASAAARADDAAMHGQGAAPGARIGDAEFWFESFQNWQSEFLSTAVLVVLSIFLRFRGSPESKPVEAGNLETGT